MEVSPDASRCPECGHPFDQVAAVALDSAGSNNLEADAAAFVRPGAVAIRQEAKSGGASTWLLFIMVFVVGSAILVAGTYAAAVLITGVSGDSGNGKAAGEPSTPLMVVPVPPARQGEVAVGMCFDEGEFEKAIDGDGSTAASCADPHDSEVYFLYDFPEGPYPGEDAVTEDMNTRCDEEFWVYVGDGYDPDAGGLGTTTWWPTETGWESGYRTGTCLLHDPEEGIKLEGSMYWSTGKEMHRSSTKSNTKP